MYDNVFTDYGKTEPIGSNDFVPGAVPSFGETEAIDSNPFNSPPTDFGKWDVPPTPSAADATTVPAGNDFVFPDSDPDNGAGSEFPFDNPNPTEVVGPEGETNFLPVVGWLVCIEGNDRGRDFKLHSGYNTIGKNPENDISIPSDNSISRERHAVLAYDSEENLFFFAPGNGVNLLRLNGKVLMSPSEIKSNDVLTIGKSKLIFIPLCTDKFQWPNAEE